MKHMKVTKKSNAQFAISAGLSALMVCSSLGVAPVLAVAQPKDVNQQAPQPAPHKKEFKDVVKQVVSYDAAVLHPEIKTQDDLNKQYGLHDGGTAPLVSLTDVAQAKKTINHNQATLDVAKQIPTVESMTQQASKDLHAKYKAQYAAEAQLAYDQKRDCYSGLPEDATQAQKDKAYADHQLLLKQDEAAIENAKSEIAQATKAVQTLQLKVTALQIASLKNELAAKVPNVSMLSNYEKWLAGKIAERDKLAKIDLGDFSEEYLLTPREEMNQTEAYEKLLDKQKEVTNRIKTLQDKIAVIRNNNDFKQLNVKIKELELQSEYLKKQLARLANPTLSDVLGGLSADDILNNAGKLHIASIEDLTKDTVDPAIETLAQKAEKEGLSFTAKQIRKAKTLDGANNLLKEAEKSAIEGVAQKAEKEGLSFTAKQIRKAKTLDGANNLLKEAEKSAIETLAQKAEKEGLSFTAKQISKAKTVEGARALLKVAEDSKLNSKPENKPEAPEPDNSGDGTTSGDSSHDNTSMSKEKAQAKKTPKTSDVLATLLPMLGVVLGGTSIAFGKHMRH